MKLCRSRIIAKNAPTLAIGGVRAAENEPLTVHKVKTKFRFKPAGKPYKTRQNYKHPQVCYLQEQRVLVELFSENLSGQVKFLILLPSSEWGTANRNIIITMIRKV